MPFQFPINAAFSPRPRGLMSLILVAGLAASLAAPCLAQPEPLVDPEIIREGVDDRRDELDDMELTMFPAENWELVTDWRLADAPTPETFDGKVVLIMTFAGWYPPSMRSLVVINRIAQDRAEEGLVVLGVHDM